MMPFLCRTHNWDPTQQTRGVLLLGMLLCWEPFVTAAAADDPPAVSGLMYNLDCAHFFTIQDPQKVTGEDIDRMIDFYADAGVQVFVCNVSGQRANFDSSVWESFWEGYDPAGSDDQPFLRGTLPEDMDSYRKMFDTYAMLHKRGVDYPARVLQHCRKRGMAGWLSVRMNDHHGLESETNPSVSRFLRQSAHLSRVRYQRYVRADRALDFTHDEVRQKYTAFLAEIIDRYDMDGLELDFCRHPLFFGIGRELEGSPLMTEWVGKVHGMLEEASRRRGHPIHLGIRIPSEPETARNIGLDVNFFQSLLVTLCLLLHL